MSLVKNMKQNKTINELMNQVRSKYIKQSKLTGKMNFSVKNDDERKDVSQFVNLKYYEPKTSTFVVNINRLEKRISELMDEEVTLIDFLEKHYFMEKITTKKAEQNNEEEKKKEFYKKQKENNEILCGFIEKHQKNIEILCKKDKETIEKELTKLNKVAEKFPIEGSTTLPFLANELFKDSHALDFGTTSFNLLIQYICYKKEYEMVERTIEEKNKVLGFENIKRDEVSNNFMTYNLIRKGDPVLQEVYEQDEVYTINLKKVQKEGSCFEGINNKIYIVENNLVFQRLTEDIEEKGEKRTVICSSGQFNTAFFEFLKRVKEGTEIYYAGDYDPEGIYMLEGMLKRRKETKPLLMNAEIYKKNIKEKEITEKRMKNLKKLTLVDKELIEAMEKEEKVLYQEEIYDSLLEEIMK